MSMVIFFVDQNKKKKSLSEFLDIKKLINVDKPIESANGLPTECYTRDQYLEYERNKIFSDKWTVIGVGSSVHDVGYAKPYNLLGIPLMNGGNISTVMDQLTHQFHKWVANCLL